MGSNLGYKRTGAVSVMTGLHRERRTSGAVIELHDSHPTMGRVRVIVSAHEDGLSLSISTQQPGHTIRTVTPRHLSRDESELWLATMGALLDGE